MTQARQLLPVPRPRAAAGVIAYDARYATRTPSGIGQVCLELLRGLTCLDDGPDLHVLVHAGTHLPPEVWDHPRFTFHALPWTPYSAANQALLPGWLRRLGVRLLHSVDCHNPLLPFGGRLVVNVHDLIPLTCGKTFSRSLKARHPLAWWAWLKLQCARATRVVCCSRHAADDVRRILGVPAERLAVIHNPIRRWDEAECPERLRQRWGLAGRVLSYVGRPEPYKNVVTLIRAMPLLNRLLPDQRLHLVLAGTLDPRYPEARREAARLGLTGQVTFPGYLDEATLGGLYRLSDAFVFPSLHEGFGMPPLEAMRFGTPVVAGRHTALPEVLGRAALYVDTQDPAALARGICDVLQDRLLAEQLRQAGRRQVRLYAPRHAARAYLRLYREALGEAPAVGDAVTAPRSGSRATHAVPVTARALP